MFVRKWERELGTQLTEQQFNKILRGVYSYAVDFNNIEANINVWLDGT